MSGYGLRALSGRSVAPRSTGGTPAIEDTDLPVQTQQQGSVQALGASATGGTLFESVDITSATIVSPSQPGEYCVGLWLNSGAAPGWLAVLYDTVNTAVFPTPGEGTDATGKLGNMEGAFYPLNIPSPGATFLAAASLTFGGGLVRARFMFSQKPNPAARAVTGWPQMRGVAVTHAESGTGGTSETYTMPGSQLLTPKGITAMSGITTGTATGIAQAEISVPLQPPLVNPYLVPAPQGLRGDGRPPRRWPMPAIGPATSYALTHTCLSLGGSTDVTIVGVLWV